MIKRAKIKDLRLKIFKSIIHYPLSINRESRGFTLVELLAVIMVIGVVGGIVGAILISSLVGTNKTNSLDNIRQSGNFALLQTSKEIEFSRNFYGVSTDGINYVTDCTVASVSPTPTPVQYKYAKIMSTNGQIITYSCSSSTISSNSASILDAATVKTDACFFTCSQDNLILPPTIGINFTLTQARVGNFTENKTTVYFNTSVTLRNQNR